MLGLFSIWGLALWNAFRRAVFAEQFLPDARAVECAARGWSAKSSSCKAQRTHRTAFDSSGSFAREPIGSLPSLSSSAFRVRLFRMRFEISRLFENISETGQHALILLPIPSSSLVLGRESFRLFQKVLLLVSVLRGLRTCGLPNLWLASCRPAP